MVDFNNESTVATPPGEVMKIVVLERREQCIEALESYFHTEGAGLDASHKLMTVRSRILALWYQVKAMAKRRLKPEEYEEVVTDFGNLKAQEEQLLMAFDWLNQFVDDMGLTYIDSRERYDRRRVEDTNTKKGL